MRYSLLYKPAKDNANQQLASARIFCAHEIEQALVCHEFIYESRCSPRFPVGFSGARPFRAKSGRWLITGGWQQRYLPKARSWHLPPIFGMPGKVRDMGAYSAARLSGLFFQQQVHFDLQRMRRVPQRHDRRVALAEFQPADISAVNAHPVRHLLLNSAFSRL